MNIRLRYGVGVDGEPILLAAFCPTCRQDALPMANGTCGFCDTRIVGNPAVKKRPRPKPRVTDHDITTALRVEAARLGHPPYAREWRRSDNRPSKETIYRRFGSWEQALEAAGMREGT